MEAKSQRERGIKQKRPLLYFQSTVFSGRVNLVFTPQFFKIGRDRLSAWPGGFRIHDAIIQMPRETRGFLLFLLERGLFEWIYPESTSRNMFNQQGRLMSST